ncbi:phage major capsid protein [Diaphorobacter sp. C33]|uniref:HK97 family phage major capsid protein n=1 Tax=Diaphorobacter nitroreducens TaxID=164759 RepID=A0AAX1WV35_9BURK|nr:phage major capsid protein [Diaphorobacter sp. C33]ROR47978.1 HK97 family phage major capsid protein [Diaphorobacter nitroreducens]WKK90950.1 phage major capsid protein [Diaphorobacter sp. C33]
MQTLHAIREARSQKVNEARALLASMPTLTPEAQTKFDAIKAEIVSLEGQEARAQLVEDWERRSLGQPADKARNELEGRVSVVEVMRAQMEGRSLTGAAAEFAQESERRTGRKAQGVFVPLAALESRAVNTTVTAPEIVPTTHRADLYIQPFRNNLLARRLGVQVLSGLSGNLSIPKHATGGTTGWVAENAALPTGDMSFDSVPMAPKHAGGIQEMSRQLLQQSSPDIEALVRNDLSALLAQAIDSALIKGGGTNEPKGVLSTVGIQTANLATLSWQNILAMLQKLDISNTSAANIVASMKVKAKLQGTLKAAGIAGYLMENGRVADLPAFFSNQVPEKTGTPNTGHLIAGDWSQALLGIWSEIDLLVNPYSETAYSKGNVLVRAMATVDVAVRHPESFVVASDVAL